MAKKVKGPNRKQPKSGTVKKKKRKGTGHGLRLAPPPPRPADEGDGGIFDVPESAPVDTKLAVGLPPPPKFGEHIITMNHRSYTPPVLSREPGGGGPMDYELFPGVVGQAVLMKDGSMWVLSPEPNEEHARDDWELIVRFLDVLHPRCRVVNCVWGELALKLVDGGWVNRPQVVVDTRGARPREIDVWYPPAEGSTEKGYVDGGVGGEVAYPELKRGG